MLYFESKLLKINMLTHFFKGINWVDLGLAVLSVRVIFISVRSGFISEVFKLLAVICALFVSLHYYAFYAALLSKKTTLPLQSLQFLVFVGLWGVMVLSFKFVRDGFLILFKAETIHEGFDKYAAGFLGAARAIFLSSLTIFALLLMRHEYIHRQAFSSFGYQVAAKAAPNTYKFLFDNLIGRLFDREKYNADVFAVVSRNSSHGTHPK